MSEIFIVRTGTANVASVQNALARAGVASQITDDPKVVRTATHIVLPGVGTFGAAMEGLRAQNLTEPLRERILSGGATLAICVGLQILAERSEESPAENGLGIFPGACTKFADGLRVPQFGWNEMVAEKKSQILESGYVYFANSYALVDAPRGFLLARSRYGKDFIAAIEKDLFVGCQFHPELSSEIGQRLIRRWMEKSRGARC